MFLATLEELGVSPADALVIGDNPDSDVAAANRAGIRGVLVLTGVADALVAETLAAERRPFLVVTDPMALAVCFEDWLS